MTEICCDCLHNKDGFCLCYAESIENADLPNCTMKTEASTVFIPIFSDIQTEEAR